MFESKNFRGNLLNESKSCVKNIVDLQKVYSVSATFFLGIGGLLFALPRLTRDPYSPQPLATSELEICAAKNITTKTCHANAKEVSHVLVFLLANFIMGAGTTPLFTLGNL